nr:MAG TPA: hypothetical protein [Caudoviricetes sp.]
MRGINLRAREVRQGCRINAGQGVICAGWCAGVRDVAGCVGRVFGGHVWSLLVVRARALASSRLSLNPAPGWGAGGAFFGPCDARVWDAPRHAGTRDDSKIRVNFRVYFRHAGTVA